ncbi:nicotinate (nicotinamide) nucleotide adenylyltransferase [Treponema sp.]|uniref:nicotinate (nicotinamide) nucleotide adenylyltransferase n=1 Tax=Treponema sp. TaxID=166 RepID=UPI0025EDB5CE|nr:nicotinate (nicotinamide) nucleotide adenylyltransferase [Treponema sp.]MCR5219269.1 nicotinate (nicotinamide) nucleotide adenylyltransferase [Treponema sp.]
MKIAVLGGSFNPVHNAHISLANQVCSRFAYDRVLFIPAFRPPHKEVKDEISCQDRIKMLELACQDDPRFECDDCEIRRGGVSYTYDTICYIEEKYKNQLTDKVGLIMGTDLFAGFKYWYRAEELAQKCTLILAGRPEEKLLSLHSNKPSGKFAEVDDRHFNLKDEPLFDSALKLDNPLLKISSTAIRDMAARGEDFSALVPEKVFDYIVKGNLYGNNSGTC